MLECPEFDLVRKRYEEVFGARLKPGFSDYIGTPQGAALGYRRAGAEPLFAEQYLDEPAEAAAARALARPVAREQLVELGNFAATNAIAMIELWGTAANDLASRGDVAIATLTAPIRRMFRRLGLPFAILAPARIQRLPTEPSDWGSYYSFDPQVCAGAISDGQIAINAFRNRGRDRKALFA